MSRLWEVCPRCQGEGIIHEHWEPCPACKGQKVTLSEDRKRLVTCDFCNGKGSADTTMRCPDCEGTGRSRASA